MYVVVEKRMAPEVEKEPSAPADDDGEGDWESGVLPTKKNRGSDKWLPSKP